MIDEGQSALDRRVVQLEGQSNFRDLGGYRASSGRHVKWGQIYRSGELSRLTVADHGHLSTLGIRTVYDLRDLGERTNQRTVWTVGPLNALASGKETTDMSAAARLASPDTTASDARAVLEEFYGKMPSLYAPEYEAIFHEILRGHTPLLLHCTGGKDRTGLVSALILASLDVPRAMIAQDYALTDRLLKPSQIPAKTPFMQRMATMPAEVQQAMIRADPAYLDAAFQAIDRHYGSLGDYLQTELGVGPRERDRLRALLLE